MTRPSLHQMQMQFDCEADRRRIRMARAFVRQSTRTARRDALLTAMCVTAFLGLAVIAPASNSHPAGGMAAQADISTAGGDSAAWRMPGASHP